MTTTKTAGQRRSAAVIGATAALVAAVPLHCVPRLAFADAEATIV
jgi:hypothetical protein